MKRASLTQALAMSAFIWSMSYAAVAGNTGVNFAPGASVGTLSSTQLNEVSGCAASRLNPDIFWMHNDSGDSARIYAVARNGELRATYQLSGATARDFEDIAVGPGPQSGRTYVYVGDIGDNGASRNTKQVYRLAEPTVGTSPSNQTVERFNFVYPDGPRDAEAMMVDRNGDVYVVSKRESATNGNRVYRFRAPFVNGQTYTGTEVARINKSWLTGGDIAVDGSRILVKTSNKIFLWLRADSESVGVALSRAPLEVPAASEPQGEAVCWDRTGTDYYTISEGTRQPFYFFKSLDSNGGGDDDAPTAGNSLTVGQSLKKDQYIESSNAVYRFYFQGDGNLVVRNMQSRNAVWAAGTQGKNGTTLVLQSDGNFVLYRADGSAAWSTGTHNSSPKPTHVQIRNDGKLVLRTSTGEVIWSS